jgi:uncharacterized protein YyaL (SSP411 family)
MTAAAPVRPVNRLAREPSPYLLQHAHNPVDWFPWGEEAFAKARAEAKPIFLSIGYSTCHWCHVMERESFEHEGIAALLNEHFVSIKVDREERPDVDKLYMTFVQSTTGGGGWPLNVFLTPDRRPFFGGTYFPPDQRHGRAGFPQVLQRLAELWQTKRGELTESAAAIADHLRGLADADAPEAGILLSRQVVERAAKIFTDAYEPRHGGFGNAPKFPQPGLPALLLRYGAATGDREAIRMVLHTCERMAAGGIHDQLGGGFARYSVDEQWLVPHFEKMLYDNAQLANLYLDAWLLSGEARHADTVRDILDYVLRDLTHPDGGFYSAEDADSEGHEGKFYGWTRAELSGLLTVAEFNVAVRYFGITEAGNFTDHSHPAPLAGQNVLSIVEPDLAADEQPLLAAAKAKLLAARAQRIRPQRDDKVLASWNGLMLAAFARAAAALGDARYLAAAEKNAAFIRANLFVPSPILNSLSPPSPATLCHRWREGQRDSVELLAGYAFYAAGLLDLYEATLDPRHLEFALALAEALIGKFYDAEQGGFWQSPASASDLIARLKDDYDGAEPSGNSVATLTLLRLAAITDRADLRAPAEATLRLFADRLQRAPQAVAGMLAALDFWLAAQRRVVFTGNPTSPAARALLHSAHGVYQPNKVLLGIAGPVDPFVRTLPATAESLAYVCTGNTCQPPTADEEMLRTWLRLSDANGLRSETK